MFSKEPKLHLTIDTDIANAYLKLYRLKIMDEIEMDPLGRFVLDKRCHIAIVSWFPLMVLTVVLDQLLSTPSSSIPVLEYSVTVVRSTSLQIKVVKMDEIEMHYLFDERCHFSIVSWFP
jgi:hypothetical protein